METATTTPRGQTDSFEDSHTIIPMVGFELENGTCEAFEYISLARVTLSQRRDSVTLYFGPATITLTLVESKERKLERSVLELYRGFLGHTINWVRCAAIVSRIHIEVRPSDDEFADVEPPSGADED